MGQFDSAYLPPFHILQRAHSLKGHKANPQNVRFRGVLASGKRVHSKRNSPYVYFVKEALLPSLLPYCILTREPVKASFRLQSWEDRLWRMCAEY